MHSNPDVLFLGKIAIDIICRHTRGRFRIVPAVLSPGGSIFNTAVLASRLGVYCGMFSDIGDDALAEYLDDFLKKENIDRQLLRHIRRLQTPLAVALVDSKGNARYSFYGCDTKKEAHFKEDTARFFRNARAAYLGSSFSYGDETFAEALRFVNGAKAGGACVWYDPNIRQASIKNQTRTRARARQFVQKADAVKLNFDDLIFLTGARTVTKALSRMRALTKALIVVTLGKKGALSLDEKNRLVRIGAFQIRVADTIGAGDAFGAGLLYRFCKSENREAFSDFIKEHMIFASAVSALTCTAAGALSGIKTLEDVNRFLKRHR